MILKVKIILQKRTFRGHSKTAFIAMGEEENGEFRDAPTSYSRQAREIDGHYALVSFLQTNDIEFMV